MSERIFSDNLAAKIDRAVGPCKMATVYIACRHFEEQTNRRLDAIEDEFRRHLEAKSEAGDVSRQVEPQPVEKPCPWCIATGVTVAVSDVPPSESKPEPTTDCTGHFTNEAVRLRAEVADLKKVIVDLQEKLAAAQAKVGVIGLGEYSGLHIRIDADRNWILSGEQYKRWEVGRHIHRWVAIQLLAKAGLTLEEFAEPASNAEVVAAKEKVQAEHDIQPLGRGRNPNVKWEDLP